MSYAESMTRKLKETQDIRQKINAPHDFEPGLEGTAGQTTEAALERLLDQQWGMAEEVSLTQMPSLAGIECKALYLLEFLEEEPGDIATELARSLAMDVLAIAETKQPARD